MLFSLKTPQWIPLSLTLKAKKDLEWMEKTGVRSVDEPLDSSMMVVSKKTSDPYICVDFTKLTESWL